MNLNSLSRSPHSHQTNSGCPLEADEERRCGLKSERVWVISTLRDGYHSPAVATVVLFDERHFREATVRAVVMRRRSSEHGLAVMAPGSPTLENRRLVGRYPQPAVRRLCYCREDTPWGPDARRSFLSCTHSHEAWVYEFQLDDLACFSEAMQPAPADHVPLLAPACPLSAEGRGTFAQGSCHLRERRQVETPRPGGREVSGT